MSRSSTVVELKAFESRVAGAFEAGLIRAPVHLSGGNEEQLIEIFKAIRPQDWVFSTWRSHYHALLKGIPEEWLWEEIVAGRSMYIENAEYKFVSSSIVGGILPIALGVALAAKWKGLDEKVWVFMGDMTALTGIAHESMRYARNFGLPMWAIIENNGLSTNTPTAEVWGGEKGPRDYNGQYYIYERQWPHVGSGRWVNFG